MYTIALGLFVIAAVFGLYMAARVFRNALPPLPAAILHGLFAASGLVVLLYAVFTGAQSMALLLAAALLVIAALGGFFMLSFHLRKTAPPKAIVVVHAAAAVVGVAIVLCRVLGMV